MANLYAITQESQALTQLIEAHAARNDGDITDIEGIIDQWSREIGLESKLDACVAVAREFGDLAERAKAEAKRYQDRAKAAEAQEQRIKAWILRCMLSAGITQVKTERHTISTANTAGSLVLDVDGTEIPDPYYRIIREVNKSALKEAVKSGDPTASNLAHIEVNTSLRIK